MLHSVYALSAVLVVFCLYLTFAPKSIIDSARRAFLADVAPPTNTRLANIKPGDQSDLAEVVAGIHVNFEVDVQGMVPQKVFLHHSVDGGKFFAIKEFSPGKNQYDPWQFMMPNVQQSMDYYLTGGDAESKHYHLNVLAAPTVSSISHDLIFPDYTKVEARKDEEGGQVEAIEGTKVTSMPRPTCRPVGRRSKSQTGRPASMTIDGKDPRILTGEFGVPTRKSGAHTRSASGPRAASSTLARSPTTSTRSPIDPRRRGSSSPTNRRSRFPPT